MNCVLKFAWVKMSQANMWYPCLLLFRKVMAAQEQCCNFLFLYLPYLMTYKILQFFFIKMADKKSSCILYCIPMRGLPHIPFSNFLHPYTQIYTIYMYCMQGCYIIFHYNMMKGHLENENAALFSDTPCLHLGLGCTLHLDSATRPLPVLLL